MNYQELRIYFERLARRNKDVRHTEKDQRFYIFNIDQMLQHQSDLPSDGFIMNYETPENGFSGADQDFFMKDRRCAFSILAKVTDADIALRDERIDACEAVADEIIRKVNEDTNLARQYGLPGYDDEGLPAEFNILNTQSFAVGPVLNNFFGMRYEFTLSFRHSITPTAEKWL